MRALVLLHIVRSFFAGRGPAYSGPQRWDLLNWSNAPAQGEQLYMKFHDSSFSRSIDMVSDHQNSNGSREQTKSSPSQMICHPWASTSYDQPTYQIWTLYFHTLRRYKRRHKIWKTGWFGVVTCHSRSLWKYRHSIGVPIVTMSLSCAVSETQRNIGRKSPLLAYSTPVWHPRWGWPHCNFTEIFCNSKLESLSYRTVLCAWS